MLYKISFLIVCGVGLSLAAVDYSESSRSSSFATPSPTPYSDSYHAPASVESKAYKEDDRRSYSDGPGHSHARTGPPKKHGPGPLSFAGHGGYGGVPLVSSPQRFLGVPQGAVIGYLAYPQPVVHSPLHHDPVGHAAPGLLPSAAFSHIAYAAPIALSPYPSKPLLGPGPAHGSSYSSGGPPYSSGPSYSTGPHHHSSNY